MSIEVSYANELEGQLDTETLTLLKKFVSLFPTPDKLIEASTAAAEKFKQNGYIYSEIQSQETASIHELDYEGFNTLDYTGPRRIIITYYPKVIVKVPYVAKTLTLDYPGSLKLPLLAPRHTKEQNSLGAEITRRIKAAWKAEEDREAVESRLRKAEEDRAREERQAERARREQADRAEKEAEDKFINLWISENGSEHLKKAAKLGLSFENKFFKEWAAATFGKQDTYIYFDTDRIGEYEPGVPPMEKLTLYEEALEKAKQIKEFLVRADLSKVYIVDEYRDEEAEAESARLAITFRVYPKTDNMFIVVQYI